MSRFSVTGREGPKDGAGNCLHLDKGEGKGKGKDIRKNIRKDIGKVRVKDYCVAKNDKRMWAELS